MVYKMDTIFINLENSETSILLFHTSYCLTLPIKQIQEEVKNVAFWNLGIYCTWKNIKFPYKNNKFKISAPKWKGKFELSNFNIRYS